MGQPLMKDGLGTAAVRRLAGALARSMNNFPIDNFCNEAEKGLHKLELKQRVHHLIKILHDYLPKDFVETAQVLLRVKTNWHHGDESEPQRSFAAWPIIDYVAVYGIDQPVTALPLLSQLTGLFSAEFAIRPFISRHFELSYAHLLAWCDDPDANIRRLASEGTRPRLPWGARLHDFCKNPQPVLALLEKLKDDPCLIVRRSVANNLNDIGKDNPALVIELCRKWQQGATGERGWIIRHATRSLVKAGHAEVFALLGHTLNPKVSIRALALEANPVSMGEDLSFTMVLQSEANEVQSLVLDYAIHHRKSNQKQRAKVFKLKNLLLQPGQRVEIHKSHPFKQITTRKYYPGGHALELLVNGVSQARVEFTLLVQD